MLTGTRIRVGLEQFSFDPSSMDAPEGSEQLRPRDALRLLQRLRPHELRPLEHLVRSSDRSSFDREARVQKSLAQQITSGRIRVFRIPAPIYSTSGKIPEPYEYVAPAAMAVLNEILETHGVMIELVDPDGNPVPNEPFRIKLPDGSVETSNLDGDGKAHITGISRAGVCKICFYERDASVWAPA